MSISNTPSHLLTGCWTISLTPAICLSFANCSTWSPFVSMSAIMSFVRQYFSSTVLSRTCSQMKWYFIAMCFDRPWNCGFFAILIVDWLSSKITVAAAGLCFRSVVSCRSLNASCAAIARAIYSASAVDRVTLVCFLLLQLIAAPLSWNGYPEVDFRSSRSPPQSASEKPTHSADPSLLNKRP